MFSFPIRDVDCDFRLLRRSAFDCINLESGGRRYLHRVGTQAKRLGLAHDRGAGASLRARLRDVAVLQAGAHRPGAKGRRDLVRKAGAAAPTAPKSQCLSLRAQGSGSETGHAKLQLTYDPIYV